MANPAQRPAAPPVGNNPGMRNSYGAQPGISGQPNAALRANPTPNGGGAPVYRNGAPVNRYPGAEGHLGQWMQQHQGQSPQQQQRELTQEPGFNRLPADQQQRLKSQLNQLNQMSPQERQRTLGYVEGMERLNPQQRQQVSGALGQLRGLPQDQQQQVRRAFNQTRRLPADQRSGAMNYYSQGMTPQQRQTYNNLMQAEPYMPLQR